MCVHRRSRSFIAMNPTLMAMIADERAVDLRSAAAKSRRGRLARTGLRRPRGLRRARRPARVAHAS
jgi:hypothetical protein